MKRILLTLLVAASATAACAQTTVSHPSVPARPAAAGARLPKGVPQIAGTVKTAFSLRYQDIKLGTGATAEFMKQVTVQYKGYLGVNGRPDDGRQFDSSYTRQSVVMDDQHKMVMGPDGKPKMTAPHPEPFAFVEGNPRLIPGWNLGVDGMKVGGKRRIFIPWQLAYGAQGRPGPDAEHPGIPAKADLIFDIELVDVKDAQMPPSHPQMSIPPHPTTPAPAPAQPAQPATTPSPSPAPATPAPPQPK